MNMCFVVVSVFVVIFVFGVVDVVEVQLCNCVMVQQDGY